MNIVISEQYTYAQCCKLWLCEVGSDLEAVVVCVIEGVGACPEDEGLAVQHVVLPHHDLHEGLAAAEVQKGPPASMHTMSDRC